MKGNQQRKKIEAVNLNRYNKFKCPYFSIIGRFHIETKISKLCYSRLYSAKAASTTTNPACHSFNSSCTNWIQESSKSFNHCSSNCSHYNYCLFQTIIRKPTTNLVRRCCYCCCCYFHSHSQSMEDWRWHQQKSEARGVGEVESIYMLYDVIFYILYFMFYIYLYSFYFTFYFTFYHCYNYLFIYFAFYLFPFVNCCWK